MGMHKPHLATVAGIYTTVATDINGCTTSSIQTINEPTPVVLTASNKCFMQCSKMGV
ncbi:MAG: hypothetical protein IPI22_14180 [Bacteroidetes bacterium]|nr:hypothetical protein [Bacteroidota bacterium]